MAKENLVIVPTYNEIENIEDIIRTVFSLQTPFHILILDDNSPDGTANIVENLQNEFADSLHIVKRKGKLGLGTAYITGFKWAIKKGYTYIYEMDADFSHNPKDLENLYLACKDGKADVAIGSRYISGVNVVNWPMSRVLLSYMASKYVRLITGMNIKDPTAGFKCYNSKVLQTIKIDKVKMIGYAFQIEMKFKAWKHGFNIVEVPIIFTDRKKGVSKMNTGIIGEAVFGVMAMKISSLFKKY